MRKEALCNNSKTYIKIYKLNFCKSFLEAFEAQKCVKKPKEFTFHFVVGKNKKFAVWR